jgi:SNF2 family DNA or RNA helicase
VHRIGQTREVRVFRLITVSDMEYKVLERSRTKLRVDALAIQAGKFNTQSTADQRSTIIKARPPPARPPASLCQAR